MAIARPRVEVEVAAAVAGLVAGTLAVLTSADLSVSLAVHLTVAGVLVTVSSLLHETRRALSLLGAGLLLLATWVRLADLGVHVPEPYTLPAAAVLLVVGLVHLRRSPDASTRTALTPALALGTVPSLLWVLVTDPVSPRAGLLGLACVALLLLGARLRWSAPLLVGAVVGAVLALVELAPYAATAPQWVSIGTAGLLLTSVGVTWERRLLDVRRAGLLVTRLR